MDLFRKQFFGAVIFFAACVYAHSAHAQDAAVIAPVVATRVDAVYPEAALREHREGTVTFLVDIDANGTVTGATVDGEADAELAEAARVAVMAWTFTPARRGETPVASRIRIPMVFRLPVAQPEPTLAPESASASASESESASASESESESESESASESEPVLEVTVRGARPPASRAASDITFDHEALSAAPHDSVASQLTSGPGIYVSRGEGDAVAHEIYLRGFNAEHGQDMELTVNGAVPINQLSHLHGQGYADLNFIIPEVVQSLRIVEGVYDPRQGDFAVAGSVDFTLGVHDRGYQLRSSYGSFNTFRQLLIAAPEDEADDTFGAVQLRTSDGFGENRASLSGGAIAQYGFDLPAQFRARLHIAAYGARAGIAGVLRRDDVNAGRVGFYDSYDDPSANAQSALATRAQLALHLERQAPRGARTSIDLWMLFAGYHSRENFTGYTQRSRTMTEWAGRGDLIEQINDDFSFGASFTHRTARYRPWTSITGDFAVGLSFRTAHVDSAQNLLQVPQNQTWDQRVDSTVRASDIGAYIDTDWNFTRYVHLRGGVRADVLHFDVDDRLGNFIPQFRPESYVQGYRRTALGLALGPRATLELAPTSYLRVLVSYGQGFRSPQARQLEEGESAPFARVHSLEAGVRFAPDDGKRVSFTTAFYGTSLSYDVAFEPQEGRLEKIGPTTRMGFVAHVIAHPWDWLYLSSSITTVRATLDAPPPATAENPSPPYVNGQLLPYVPPVVVRLDASAKQELATLWGEPLLGRVGLGFSYLSSRPLPYGASSDSFALLDGSVSLRYRFLELGVDAFNLFDSRYAASEYSFVSSWQTTAHPSLVPARHLAAGAPFTVMFNLGVTL